IFNNLNTNAVKAQQQSTGDEFYGLNYGLNIFDCPSYYTMKNDFSILKQYTNRVRIFGLALCDQADNAIRATQELGMRLYLTIWMDHNPASFEKEFQVLQDLLSRHDFHNVDGIIVGSEVLYREDMSIGTLLQYIQRVKTVIEGRGISITSADTFDMITSELAAPLDFVMINIFPYWESVSIDNATNILMRHYDETINRVGGKVVRISETGWPSQGLAFGEAIASPENQNRYLREVLCRTRQRGVDMLWFSAIDEPYKKDVEGHFGIFEADTRNLKSNHRIDQLSAC
ncbi:hypothetical protein INT45_004432, partial [Circinella minor]